LVLDLVLDLVLVLVLDLVFDLVLDQLRVEVQVEVEVEVHVQVQVHVQVEVSYFTRVPGAIESPTVTTVRLGGSPAARSIPCEVIPRSGRGARLATTTMRRPTRACGSG
jgi:hypothetical protein